MAIIENLMKEGKISRVRELELERYVNFFENSYKDNLEHSKAVMKTFPRWSIISGYYAMHDIAKLLLAKKFISLANDLAEAKRQRTKAQYYTGSKFMRERFAEMSEDFISDTVEPYIKRIKILLEGDSND